MTRKTFVASLLSAAMAMTMVPAVAQADEITDLYTYQTQVNEMETFNILYSQSAKELDVLTNTNDGLLTNDNYGKLAPAIAETWGTEDGGLTWTFNLRDNVKWVDMNGNEKADLTAQDFLTGLEWVLNFSKNNAANTSMPVEMIVGAQEYYDYTKALAESEGDEAVKALTTDGKFAELVGIKAVDDYTLQYTCVSPKPYFDTVATYNCLYPLSQAMVDELGVDGVIAMDNTNMWYSGPYVMTEYIQGNEKILEQNPLWYGADENTRFNSVTIKMVESIDSAFTLYENGELDNIDLSESNLTTIYNNESHPLHDYLVEARPTKYSYEIHFNYNQKDADGNDVENWNKAVANEAFRKSWYYGLELGDWYKRTNNINPYKCYNNAYTMKGLVYFSDGTEYTARVQELLGLPEADGTGMTRIDAEKAAEYKAQAIEELTAAGVTFPVTAKYYVSSANQTAIDTANVLKQAFSDSLGDDYVVLEIDYYISSLKQEVVNPRLNSFLINGWGADYGDPQNYLGQEISEYDNAYYSQTYSHPDDNADEALTAAYDEFTDLVWAADAITDNLDERYEAYAKAEACMLEHALVVPAYFNITWELTKINDYSKINAMYGIQNRKFINWETNSDGYTTADYEAFAEAFAAGAAE